MPHNQGFSLHIGVNRVNNTHYLSRLPELRGSVNDAESMRQFAVGLGYTQSIPLFNEQATAENVIGQIRFLAGKAQAGDIVLITYSGHGGFVMDFNADDELTFSDQVWCLHNRFLFDDEVRRLCIDFKPGVDLIFLFDSCNSGTAARWTEPPEASLPSKQVTPGDAIDIFQAHLETYRPIALLPPAPDHALRATVLSLSACQDDQEANERLPDRQHGYFTSILLAEIKQHGIPASYQNLVDRMVFLSKTNIPPQFNQTPNLDIHGPEAGAIANQKPFVLS